MNILQGRAREEALDQLRIELFETQGIIFDQQQPQVEDGAVDQHQDLDEQSDGEGETDSDGEESLDAQDEDAQDDGDYSINEDQLTMERFADDQSDDGIPQDGPGFAISSDNEPMDWPLMALHPDLEQTAGWSANSPLSAEIESPASASRPVTPMDAEATDENKAELNAAASLRVQPGGWQADDEEKL
jgi:hypothetical protein